MASHTTAMASAVPTGPPKVAPQAGVLEGMNPVHFDAKNPIILFIVQASLAPNQSLLWENLQRISLFPELARSF